VFRSFWMGGYEGADHVNSHGVPLQIQLSNGHAQCYELDYAAAARIGLRTVRESVGWRSSTRSNGKLDLPRLQRMADAAERQGVQVILTLHHYGLPPGMEFDAPVRG
jgi:beta-glucosidase/6-phospho-beta-glucosidase/beta-galactosidase